jgi:hypothetical protein
MIPVERVGSVPARLNLDDETSLASIERQTIINGLKDGKPADDTKFSAYSDKSVRDALQNLFHNKCAYCESKIAGSQDTDIEHYRPKGRVSDADRSGVVHHGYWWLAMDWTNLVLACMHCNQRRRQLIYMPGMTEEQIVALIEADRTVTVGKLDAFPTEDSVWITDYKLNVATEKPLLIDPTRVNPELHLDWVLSDKFSTVRARNGSRIGQTSIDVYALNRRRLTEDRMTKLLVLRSTGNLALKVLSEAVNEPDDTIAAHREKTALELIDLVRVHCSSEQPYAGLARAYLAHLVTEISTMQAG